MEEYHEIFVFDLPPWGYVRKSIFGTKGHCVKLFWFEIGYTQFGYLGLNPSCSAIKTTLGLFRKLLKQLLIINNYSMSARWI